MVPAVRRRGVIVDGRRRRAGCLLGGSPAPVFGYKGQDGPKQTYERGRDGVGSDLGVGRTGELQAQAAVHDAEDNHAAADPKMGVGPGRPAAEPLESAVVQPAEKGLEEQHGQDYEADDGMGVGLGRLELRGDVSTREAREAELEAKDGRRTKLSPLPGRRTMRTSRRPSTAAATKTR